MYEGDSIPSSHRPKPLTKAQLRKLQEEFAWASEKIEKIRELEKEEYRRKGIDAPRWL